MKNKKMVGNKKKVNGKVIFQIANLVIALFAFSFLISLASESVSGQDAYVGTTGKTLSQIMAENQKASAAPAEAEVQIDAGMEKMPTGSENFVKPPAPLPSKTGPLALSTTPTQTLFNVPAGTKIYNPDTGQLVTQLTKKADGKWYLGNKEVTIPEGVDPKTFTEVTSSTSTTKPGSELSKLFGITEGGGLGDALLTGLQWGAVAAGIGYLIGTIAGFSAHNSAALAISMGAGAFVWRGLATYETASGKMLLGASTPTYGFFIGLGVAAIIFVMMYKKTSSKAVQFECKPYEAPTGGQYCELCNKDKFRPCTEYRCKSLGQACQLLNAGTGKEACAWVNPNDVTTPTIAPWQEPLTKGHSYTDVRTRPPGTGMKVVLNSASDGCIKAFTALSFGISTNEPSQCKIDYNHTVNVRDVKNAYDTMAFYFGESNIYAYNHSQTLRLPGPAALAAQNISPEIGLDGVYTLYVRCQDANGNVNEDEFAIRFCVEKGPDTTPAKIEGTSIASGMPVSFNTNDTDLEVYVNEPADCRWSKQDKDYEQMENQMVCDQNVWEINTNMLYKCNTKLTGLENRKDNQFYFRCKDQPYAANPNDRNTNSESYPFVIKGSQPLNIKANSIKPNGTIQGFADVVSIDLTLETENGYNGKGDSICYYSTTGADSSYIKMFETNTNKHKQNQQLPAGAYTYYFKCVDLGGNADYGNNTFSIEIDRSSPKVTRVYNEGNNLRIETDEKSTCYYSENSNQKCNFQISEGKQMLYSNVTAHYTEWKTNNNLYIKCMDSSANQPNPVDCSIIVRGYNAK